MDASTLVIFGASGDLTHRKLVPSLFHLYKDGLLPKDFQIVGFARRDWDKETFAAGLRNTYRENKDKLDEKAWANFTENLHYVQGDLGELKDYLKLAQFLKKFDPPNSCTNKIFYLATAPSYFPEIITNLENAKVHQLMGDCWIRVIIEKPFGNDLESAKALNKLVDEKFSEESIYRIDHYLAKETVQNILTFRFANGIFEPLWNKDYIDSIQITVAETLGVEKRGGYYEESGNLRDFIQNHILQLLALTTMEQPKDFNSESIRDSRLAVLKQLVPLTEEDLDKNLVLGQYTEGKINGEKVVGYREEPKVDPNSRTDTFTALKLFIDSPRWQKVPIYIRSGKRLPESSADISVLFKEPANRLFPPETTIPNVLTFHIQPDQAISIRVMAKEPGHSLQMRPVAMHMKYEEAFETKEAEPYEKLILDIIEGVQTLFPRCDEVEEAWKFVDPIIKNKDKLHLYFYPSGTWGPKEAAELLEKDGKDWFTH